jgi:HNH endonuclease
MSTKGIPAWNKGKKMPHSPEWEAKRIAAVRAWAAKKDWPSGYTRPKSATQPMIDALRKRMKKNPEKYRNISMQNLSRDRSGSLSGANSPNWRGGKTAKVQRWKNQNRAKLHAFRCAVLERDGNKCKDCGRRSDLEVHHIMPVAGYPQFAFLRMNGVTLCGRCHKKTDNFGGSAARLPQASGFATMATIPHHWQDYPTVGNWQFGTDNSILIFVSKMNDDIYEFLVLVHELIEVVKCRQDGVTAAEVDKFDMEFEKNRKKGSYEEPGFSEGAPYAQQHLLASGIEMILAGAFGVHWGEYEKAINALP